MASVICYSDYKSINLNPPPEPRQGSKLVSNGTKIYLFGGRLLKAEGFASYSSNLFQYDLRTDKWDAIFTASIYPEGRRNCAIVLHGNFIYMYGGQGRKLFSDLWTCSLDKRICYRILPSVSGAPVLVNGYLFIRGRTICITGGTSPFYTTNNRIYCLNLNRPETGWKPVQFKREIYFWGGAFGYYPKEDILISFGGIKLKSPSADVFKFHFTTGINQNGAVEGDWENVTGRTKGQKPSPRSDFSAVTWGASFQVGWDRSLLKGGEGVFELNVTDLEWRFVTNKTLRNVTNLRTSYASVALENNSTIFLSQRMALFVLESGGKRLKQLKFPVRSPRRRSYHCSVNYGGYFLVLGGKNSFGNLLGDFWGYHTPSGRWIRMEDPFAESPVPRYLHACAVAGTKLFLYGGIDQTGRVLSDFWVTDLDVVRFKVNWRLIALYNPPGSRKGHTLTNVGDYIVLGGGSSVRTAFEFDVFSGRWESIPRTEYMLGMFGAAAASVRLNGRERFLLVGSSGVNTQLGIYLDGNPVKIAPGNTIPGWNNFFAIFLSRESIHIGGGFARFYQQYQSSLRLGETANKGEIITNSARDYMSKSFMGSGFQYKGNLVQSFGGNYPFAEGYPLYYDQIASKETRTDLMGPLCTAIQSKNRRENPVCFECSRGTFIPKTLMNPVCRLCPAGTYNENFGSYRCTPCRPGFFGDVEGEESIAGCKPCPEGTYQSQRGRDHCLVCLEEHFCPLASAWPTVLPRLENRNTLWLDLYRAADISGQFVVGFAISSIIFLLSFVVSLLFFFFRQSGESVRDVPNRRAKGVARVVRPLRKIDLLRHKIAFGFGSRDNLAEALKNKWSNALGGILSLFAVISISVVFVMLIVYYSSPQNLDKKAFTFPNLGDFFQPEVDFEITFVLVNFGGICSDVIEGVSRGETNAKCSKGISVRSNTPRMVVRNLSCTVSTARQIVVNHSKAPGGFAKDCVVRFQCDDCVQSKGIFTLEIDQPQSYTAGIMSYVTAVTGNELIAPVYTASIFETAGEGQVFRGDSPQRFECFFYPVNFRSVNAKRNGSWVFFSAFEKGSTADRLDFHYTRGLTVELHFKNNPGDLFLVEFLSRTSLFEIFNTFLNSSKTIYRVLAIVLLVIETVLVVVWPCRGASNFVAAFLARKTSDEDEVIFNRFVENYRSDLNRISS